VAPDRPIPATPPLSAARCPCPRRSAAIHVGPAGPGRPEGGPLGRAQFRSALASSTGPRPPPHPHLAGSPAQRQREDCLSTAQEARPTGRPAAVPLLSRSPPRPIPPSRVHPLSSRATSPRPIPTTPPLTARRPCPRRSAAIHVDPAGPGRPEGGPLGRAQFRSALASSTGPRPPPPPHLAGSPAQRQREDCLSTAQEARPTGRPAAVPRLSTSRSPATDPRTPSRDHRLSSRAPSSRPIPATPPLSAARCPYPRRSAAIHVDPAGPGRPEGGPLGRAQFRSALASSTGPRPPPPPHLAGSPAQRQREDCLSTAQEARPTGRPAAVPRLSRSPPRPIPPLARPSALVARHIPATDPGHPTALRRAVPVPPPIGRYPRRPCRPWAARGRAPGPRAVPQRPGAEHRSPPTTAPAPRRIPRPRQREDCLSTAQEARPTGRPAAGSARPSPPGTRHPQPGGLPGREDHLFRAPKKKKARFKRSGPSEKTPAATYSPTELLLQYHRPWRA
jgi:hypothetical protein